MLEEDWFRKERPMLLRCASGWGCHLPSLAMCKPFADRHQTGQVAGARPSWSSAPVLYRVRVAGVLRKTWTGLCRKSEARPVLEGTE